jgi:TP901 family phage tail tape measure protein
MSRSVEVQVQSSGVEGFTSSLDGAADALTSMKGAAGIAAGALAALAGGALATSIQKASEFEDAMVEVRKVTAEGVGKKLRDDVKAMAAEIPLARKELAAITADAARFGITGQKNIREFAETAAKMATATNLSANEAGESLAKLATITDTPVSKMENLGSAVNSLSNNFATSTDEIVTASLKASGSLSQLGVRQTDIFALTTALNEVSPSARRAGTRLRRVGQELLNPKKAKEVASALGMTASEFENALKNDPTSVFKSLAQTMNEGGASADKLRNALSSASRTAISKLSGNLDGLNSALSKSKKEFDENTSIQEEFNLKVNTFSSQLQLLKSRIGNAAIEIGNVFLPPLTNALDAINGLIDANDGLLGAISAQQAAWGLLGTVVAGTIGALVGILGAPLAPILAIVGAVGALAAAWKTNFAGIREDTKQIASVVMGSLSLVKDIVMNVLSDVLAVWQKNGAAIMSNVEDIWSDILDVVVGVVTFLHKNVIQPALSTILDLWKTHGKDLLNEISLVYNSILRGVKRIINGFEAVWAAFGDEIVTITKFAFDMLIGIVSTAMDALFTTISVVLNLLNGDWHEAWKEIKGFVSRTLSGLIGFIKKWGGRLLSWLGGLLGRLVEWAKGVGAGIKKWFLDGVDSIVQGAKDAFNGLVEWLKGLPKRIKNAITGFAKGVGGRIKQAINNALGLPREITIGDVSVQGTEVFSGKTFTIPALAEGGIVDSPTMAMVGEAGSEAVIPLDRLESMIGAGGVGGAGGADVGASVRDALAGTTLEVADASFTLDDEVVTVDKMELRFEKEAKKVERAERRNNTRRR